jgi:hypothetical protein
MIALAVPLDRDITQLPTISGDRADVFFWVAAAGAGAFVLWGLVSLGWRRSPVLALCLIGSVACNLNEPIWDALGKLRFHHGNRIAWTEFGDLAQPVQYPWWAMFVYTGFAGVACYVFYWMFTKRSWRLFWTLMAGQAVMNIVLEGFVITSGYDYYGHQPWRVGTDFPLWWVAVNYGELLGGALLALAIRRWGARGALAAIPIVPCAFSAWQLWAGWPTYAAINLDIAEGWRDVAAGSSLAIGAVSCWLIGRALIDNAGPTPTAVPVAQTEVLVTV